jgi:tetratricopeptide (TPR) repeat protein
MPSPTTNHQPPTTTSSAPALLVLGMHRSGTSCVAGLLAAAGARVPGPAVRNWDNPRGHHEATAVIRLNEEVLAHSGGSWLAAPEAVRWTDDHAAVRDALLAPVADSAALIKDPRCLLALPFWLATPVRALGVLRHPAAVAASLRSWRGMAAAESWALWLAHNRGLADGAVPLIDFDAGGVVEAVAAWSGTTSAAIAGAYAPEAVHHRGAAAADDVPAALRAAAEALHSELRRRALNHGAERACLAFPWAQIAAAVAGDSGAVEAALTAGADPAAVLVTLTTALTRAGKPAAALAAVEVAAVPPRLRALLRAKALLALDRPQPALAALEPALAETAPDWEARALRPTLLRRCGEREAARSALAALVTDAIHPWQEVATLAVWEREDGVAEHRAHLLAAIAAAPMHRRGRLLCRLARWALADGDHVAAGAALARCRSEDPGWVVPGDMLTH